MSLARLLKPVQRRYRFQRGSSRRSIVIAFYVVALLGASYYVLDSMVSSFAPTSHLTDELDDPLAPHAETAIPFWKPWAGTRYASGKSSGKSNVAAAKKRKAAQAAKAKSAKRKSPDEAQAVLKRPPKLAPHTYRDDGLLELNPDGRHPIFDLITRAETEWERRMKRASKSLDEAVAEYKRRYKRPPPKGFDLWWDYVEEHDVLLPDEYDQIERDLGLFWAVSPADLRRLQQEHEGHRDSWTIGKTNHGLQLVNTSLPDENQDFLLAGAYEMMEVLHPIEEQLPAFRAVFSPHDNGNLIRSHQLEEWMRSAISQKRYIDLRNIPNIDNVGWRSGCAPTSPARTIPYDLKHPPPPQDNKTFIWDHRLSMDICQHPSHLHNHGTFLSFEFGPMPSIPLVPQLSYSTTSANYDMAPANPSNWVDDVRRSDDPEWDRKADDRLLWRGRNTGMYHSTSSPWRSQQRIRLVRDAHRNRGTAKVLVNARPDERVREKNILLKRLNPVALDVEFADSAIGCDEETCRELREMFDFEPSMNQRDQGDYKYIMDIDGNGWSSRFKRLMTTNALVFKSTIYNEWFSDRVMPWVHYVPIQLDLSDLYDTLVFFRGDINGEGAHDDMAKKIAYEGRNWSRTMWRREDLTAYMFRFFLEYARLMSYDRATMNYQDPDEVW